MRKRDLFCVGLCMVLLCGCGAPQRASGETVAEEKPTLTLMATGGAQDQFGAAAQAFQEKRGIRVEFVDGNDAAQESLERELAAGELDCDLLQVEYSFGCPYTADGWVDAGYFLPLEHERAHQAVDAMWPVLQDLVVRGQSVYALPVAARPYVLLANRPLVAKDWGKLLESKGLPACGEGLLWSCLLEQYMLSCDEEGFTFDDEAFVRTLELAGRAYRAKDAQTGTASGLRMGLGSAARLEQTSLLGWSATADRLGWLPSEAGETRIPMKVGTLAIPVGAPHPEEARDFVAEIASMGLYRSTNAEPGRYPFGGPDVQACYALEEHIACAAGDDPDNRDRWRSIMEQAEVTPHAGFLTDCWLKEIRACLEGVVDARTCAARVQALWEEYQQ